MRSQFQADAIITPSFCYHHSQLLAQMRGHTWPLTFCIESKPAHCFHCCHYNYVRNGWIWIFHMCTHYYPCPWHLLWMTYQPQYHSWAIQASIYNHNSQDQGYREHHIIISYSSSAVTITSSLWAAWLALPFLILDTLIISLKVSVSYLRTSTHLYLAPVTVIRLYHHIPSFPMTYMFKSIFIDQS